LRERKREKAWAVQAESNVGEEDSRDPLLGSDWPFRRLFLP
jgi:hypothetical protein